MGRSELELVEGGKPKGRRDGRRTARDQRSRRQDDEDGRGSSAGEFVWPQGIPIPIADEARATLLRPGSPDRSRW